jgi:chemotaxis protein methyltransferase CheR
MNATELAPFKDLIRTRCGLLLEGVGEEPLVIAIRKRMAETGATSATGYFAKMAGHEDEFQEFVTLLTINETYFFREPDQLSLLMDRLIPRLLADETGRLPIRILSAGCSTGEEPYSIAIALLEKYGDAATRMVQIVGGDIDHHALAKARAGRYTAFSFRSLAPELRQRYFHPSGRDGMVIDDRVKAMVSFHHLNLLAEHFPPPLSDLDVVFFRNVSIYFDEATRKAIQQTFERSMTERGHLVIGSAETLANDLGVFRLVQDDGAFYFRRGQPEPPPRPVVHSFPTPVAMAPRPPLPTVAAPPPTVVPPRPGLKLDEIRALIRDKRFDRIDLLLGARNRLPPADPALLALEGYARMLARDFAAAAELGKRALAADEWSVDALVLLGLAAKWQGAAADAIGWFKKVLYVRRECWPAHYYLADLHRSAGAAEAAQRCYRAALQYLAEQPDPDGGLVLPLGLPVSEVRFLCERHTGAIQSARR